MMHPLVAYRGGTRKLGHRRATGCLSTVDHTLVNFLVARGGWRPRNGEMRVRALVWLTMVGICVLCVGKTAAAVSPGETEGMAAERLYEEDPVSSMSIREEQWREIQRYAENLGTRSGTSSWGRPSFPASEGNEGLRDLLRNRIGYPPPGFESDGAMRLLRVGEDALATYYRCWIRVAPEMEVYGLYLIPKQAASPAPLVIAQHGGGGSPEIALFNGGSNYHDLVRGPLRHGWIVFAPYHLFYPFVDRDHGTSIPKDVRERLDAQLREHGTSIAAVEVAKISRALDVLLRRKEIDSRRVAMAGLSYGGYYSLYVASLEPRIKVVVASCSFAEWGRETNNLASQIRNGGRLCDLSPVELGALICPRPLQVQAGKSDDLFKLADTRPQAERTAWIYERAGRAGAFSFEAFEGGHEFCGNLAWPFIERQFR